MKFLTLKQPLYLFVAFLLSGFCVLPLSAETLNDHIFVSGFVSQGYLNSTANNYLTPRSVHGSADFLEAAVSISANPMDRLRVGTQFMGRNFGDAVNGEILVDWAYGDFRWRDELGIRAGKVRMPYGLYNEGRNVDVLRTGVFLPQSIYNEDHRDFIQSYEGIGAYGNISFKNQGEVSYHFFGGTLSVPDASLQYWRDLYSRSGSSYADVLAQEFDSSYGLEPGTSSATFDRITDLDVSMPWVWGGALVWTTPLEGLRLGSTFLNGRFHCDGQYRFNVSVPGAGPVPQQIQVRIPIDDTRNIDHIITASVEYTLDDVQLVWEYHKDKISVSESEGWYWQAGYQASNLFSLAGCYSVEWPDIRDKNGENLEAFGVPAYYAWQKDFCISTRFDLTDFWLFKLEYHFVDGAALTEYSDIASSDTLDRHWTMFAAKTSFHF